MANLNKVFLMGNLTRDPELRYTQSGTALASFGVAVSRNWTSQDGEKKEDVCFVDITMFGKRAEIISEYFSKGSPIFVEGRLQFSQWESKDGQKRSALRVVAEDFQFIGQTKKRGSPAGATQPEGGSAPKDDISEEEIPF
ncbi:MAG: single-stranded DNA-binding protein [Candidatus Brocadiales bacterium]|nr:single-stranded DNA-binding protein [Candidatus Bathyanammoxibius sp.]MCQ4574676.1 single-stranded DNA-binding protein [Candidatus Bathyanammoxibius amoris]